VPAGDRDQRSSGGRGRSSVIDTLLMIVG